MENPSDNKTSLLCYEEIIDSPTVLKRNESVKGQGSCLKLSNIKSNNVIKNYLSDDKNRRLVLGQVCFFFKFIFSIEFFLGTFINKLKYFEEFF